MLDLSLIRIDVIISVMTILGYFLTSEKNKWGQLILFLVQPLWWVVTVQLEQWGWIPMNIFLTVITFRGTVRWFKDDRDKKIGSRLG